MKILIVEDDFTSRKLLQTILAPYGDCDMAMNGLEAVDAFKAALEANAPYELICLDIMMPEMDGQEALKIIRGIEKERGLRGPNEAKVVMITALDDPRSVVEAYYKGGATSYIPKPIDKHMFIHLLRNLGLIE